MRGGISQRTRSRDEVSPAPPAPPVPFPVGQGQASDKAPQKQPLSPNGEKRVLCVARGWHSVGIPPSAAAMLMCLHHFSRWLKEKQMFVWLTGHLGEVYNLEERDRRKYKNLAGNKILKRRRAG